MGYNNNNAGMHFVNWKHPKNMSFYDELVEKRRKNGERYSYETVDTTKGIDKPSDYFKCKVTLDYLEETINKYETTEGDEAILSDNIIEAPQYIITNAIVCCLQRNVDIKEIVKKCEVMIYKDSKTRRDPLSLSIMLLSLLANELDVSINTFLIERTKKIQYYVNVFLDEISFCPDSWEIWEHFNIFKEYSDVTIARLKKFEFNDLIYRSNSQYDKSPIFMFKYKWKGEYHYSLNYHDVDFNKEKQIMALSTVLWNETEGRLKDYFEWGILDFYDDDDEY